MTQTVLATIVAHRKRIALSINNTPSGCISNMTKYDVVPNPSRRVPYVVYMKSLGAEVVAKLLGDSSNRVFRVEWATLRAGASASDAELRAALVEIEAEARRRECSFCFIDEIDSSILSAAEQLGFSRHNVMVGKLLVEGAAKVLY